jgi:ATP phosphoribosyltransferase
MSSTEQPLILAIPSKGRLQENANAYFAQAGMAIRQSGGARGYRGHISGLDGVEIAFLSSSEIAGRLAAGEVHLGVTGEDLVRERIADVDSAVELVTPLGFGQADVVVAVPQSWIDVATMADLDDVAAAFHAAHRSRMRVATKYVNLTRGFFARHGIVDYRIVESLGATEGAPSAGAAELIVDITTTGATLAANALKILDDGVILRSQANLAVSLRAAWDEPRQALLRDILGRVMAQSRAEAIREVRFAPPAAARARLVERACGEFGCVDPFGEAAGGLVVLHCPQESLHACVAALQAEGIDTIAVNRLDDVFQIDNPLYDRVATRLSWPLPGNGSVRTIR